mmetsp:Transcript_2800/g.4047  ORF Transcript_2800/g.4047 Transcript_2800/m.4047 type:complete len:108 (+) Transcript_2800:392-715(+)
MRMTSWLRSSGQEDLSFKTFRTRSAFGWPLVVECWKKAHERMSPGDTTKMKTRTVISLLGTQPRTFGTIEAVKTLSKQSRLILQRCTRRLSGFLKGASDEPALNVRE